MSLQQQGLQFIETLLISAIGGYLFYLLDLPLPWVLGALTFVVLWQSVMKRKAFVPNIVRDSGFIVLGINFGMYFTVQTFQTVGNYIFPYLVVTILLIAVAITLGWLVSKRIEIDRVTSIFACIPGGLTEMTIASGDLKGNPSFVAIFQTIRLIAVLFIVPSMMTFVFTSQVSENSKVVNGTIYTGNILDYLWFLIPAIFAYLIKNKIPAGIVIGALILTSLLNISPVNLPVVPNLFLYGAQILVGASLGKNILLPDLKKAGKYGMLFLSLSILIIVVSFGLGALLAGVTTLNLPTAMLSIAPGGLFEMVLTAYSIGGDPAIVSALQLVRILVIVTCVPPFLKWVFERKPRADKRASSKSASL